MIDVGAVARLLYEDPDSWWHNTEGELTHSVGYRIRSTKEGLMFINGFRQGWWSRFVLNRAIKGRQRFLVERYLARKAQTDLDREQAEVDRIFAELDAHKPGA